MSSQIQIEEPSDLCPRLVVAGTASGVGKTTATVALTAMLRARGLRVQVFKCGPDYLDPTYHARASGRSVHNLDGWMMGREAVLQTFSRCTSDADIALIEGVMGLFDGAKPDDEEGSTAQIAKWLDAPIMLVVDASGMARSIAATAHGYSTFDQSIRVEGIWASRVGSPGHLQLLRATDCPVPILGGLPRNDAFAFTERHLGLVAATSKNLSATHLDALREASEQYSDVNRLLEIARVQRSHDANGWKVPQSDEKNKSKRTSSGKIRIAIAKDAAFSFYYDANLAALESAGAELKYFSPLLDVALPECDAVYFGGGYPELFADELAKNDAMRESIQAFAQDPKKLIYGECGGLMYLGRTLRTKDGKNYDMLGLLDLDVEVLDRLSSLGYAEVETTRNSALGPSGTVFRGHQFRYSNVTRRGESVGSMYKIRGRRGRPDTDEGYFTNGVLGSYVHAHWASNPSIADAFVDWCRRGQSATDGEERTFRPTF